MSDWFKRYRIDWIFEIVWIFGYINREHIMKKFGVSMQQASMDIRDAMSAYPNRIEYNKTTKRYEQKRGH